MNKARIIVSMKLRDKSFFREKQHKESSSSFNYSYFDKGSIKGQGYRFIQLITDNK